MPGQHGGGGEPPHFNPPPERPPERPPEPAPHFQPPERPPEPHFQPPEPPVFRPPDHPPGFFFPPRPIVPMVDWEPQHGWSRPQTAYGAFYAASGGYDPFSGQPLPNTFDLLDPSVQAVFERVAASLSRPLL